MKSKISHKIIWAALTFILLVTHLGLIYFSLEYLRDLKSI